MSASVSICCVTSHPFSGFNNRCIISYDSSLASLAGTDSSEAASLRLLAVMRLVSLREGGALAGS